MRMIYGSLLPVKAHELAENEKQNVVRMMAALGSYPWEAESLHNLAGGAFGVHAGGESSGPSLIPARDGLAIAADVRLDNREQLIDDLRLTINDSQSKIVNRKSEIDDSELLLLAYQKWGTDCAAHLLGDFAFAIRDEAAGRLFCARDFIGARPFYYCYVPGSGRFVFASDLLALAAHPNVPMQLNLAYVAAALMTGAGQFLHPKQTYYQAIEKLPPAHCLTLEAGDLRSWAYWQPGRTPERRYANEQDYVDELRTLLHEAVACRVGLPGPHSVGAHISGGLDSSSIAVLAHRILKSQGRSVTGFSWAPPLPADPAGLLSNDERKLVEETRQAEGFPVRYVHLTPAHFLAHACRDITLQPTTTLQHELAVSEDAASLGIRTMLSGWGGDELITFNGRGYYADLLRRGHWRTLQRELTQRHQLHGGRPVWELWIKRGLMPLLPAALQQLLRPEKYAPAPPLPTYLRPDFAKSLSGLKPLLLPEAGERPGVRTMQIALLQHGHLSYRMESWASHGATLGIRYAFPLLDQRLVEFALSIPDYFFSRNGWMRYLYRTVMAGILPDSLRWQKLKEDPAMVQGAREVRKENNEQLWAELLKRGDNPYVDVEQLAAALEAQASRSAAAGPEGTRQSSLSPRMRQQMNVGRGMWLAFVSTKTNENKESTE